MAFNFSVVAVLNGRNRFQLPEGADILDIFANENGLFLHVLADEAEPKESRIVDIYRVESSPNVLGRYIGNAIMDGEIVHAFDCSC